MRGWSWAGGGKTGEERKGGQGKKRAQGNFNEILLRRPGGRDVRCRKAKTSGHRSHLLGILDRWSWAGWSGEGDKYGVRVRVLMAEG